MQQIADWLKSLDLEQYVRCFDGNDIDFSILRELNDQDLEKIGVASLGHRRKLLRAIADLKNVEKSTAMSARPAGVAPVAPSPSDSAERRRVTVMFSDLVGSTALSARMDPEDLREVISAYQNRVAETVRRFGGFIAKYMGDGVLVYFGYPHAHEDDAEQAVRAGLALIAAVTDLKSQPSLQTRVGIATGLVVVGDLIGSGDAQERGIVGETPNLAARLQAIAEPDRVVIGESTRRLIGNLFELQDLGPRELKGLGSVSAWVVLRQGTVEGRFEALHGGGLPALVGREEELELLLRRWRRAQAAAGQVVLLSGEPGIGKSRLTAALMERIASEPHARLRYFCSPQHGDSAFYPIIGQIERAAGFSYGDETKAKLDKLDVLLLETTATAEDRALFAELLSLSNDGRHPTLTLDAQRRRQRTLQALQAQLEALASRQPVLMVFEDVHWIDPTSLEVLNRTVERIANIPVLLVVTLRPEFNPPWVGQSRVATVTLNRLGERDTTAIIEHLAGEKKLPADVMAEIIERTDGIPLFVEEMTNAVLESESEGAARRTVATVPSPALAVPASLHASLMARLDRLGPAKEVAQIGAAIGRKFSHALLASVIGESGVELGSALDRLIQAGLLFRQGVPPYATYLFKHALVQDAAYDTLLREPRRALHARIAEALESQFVELVELQPELLAHHCTKAGMIEKASALWGKSGQRSLARSALVEATVQISRALDQIAVLPNTGALRREQIKLQVALANALMHVKGYAAPDTKASLDQARLFIERAEALGEAPEDPLVLFSVLYGFWVANHTAFNGDAVRALSAEFLALAEKQKAIVPMMIGHRLVGRSLLDTGDITEGLAHCDRSLTLYDPAEHRLLATRFGQDTRVATLSFRSLGLWLRGYPEAALADTNHAINDAREIGQAAALMFALAHALLPILLSRDYPAANARADELVALATEKGSSLWKACGMMMQGLRVALCGKASTSVQIITSGMIAWRAAGSTLWTPLVLSYLAKSYAVLGQFDEAWRCIGEAMLAIEKTKETWSEAEVNRIAGEIVLLSADDSAKAEAYFERALAVSRRQRAKSWELRAAMSIARLWRREGKQQQARDLLAPIYGWFTEGFNTLDLEEARALLHNLKS